MPVTLQPTSLKYKNTSGQFQTATAIKGEDGVGVPNGGTVGQVLTKKSGTDYDTEWQGLPTAAYQQLGVVKMNLDYGVYTIDSGANQGLIYVNKPTSALIKAADSNYRPIVPSQIHEATFYGLAKAAGADMKNIASTTVGVYPEAQKSAISTMLNGSVPVTGTTPTITALPGIRYVCGEVATLDITLPASGIVDVVFESGSTPTVLTITPPSGVTLKWANGFDPTALGADTTYEINIADGLGVAVGWT